MQLRTEKTNTNKKHKQATSEEKTSKTLAVLAFFCDILLKIAKYFCLTNGKIGKQAIIEINNKIPPF